MRVISDELMNGRPRLTELRRHAVLGQAPVQLTPVRPFSSYQIGARGNLVGFSPHQRTRTSSRGLLHDVINCPELSALAIVAASIVRALQTRYAARPFDCKTNLLIPFSCSLFVEHWIATCTYLEHNSNSTVGGLKNLDIPLDAITRPCTVRSDGRYIPPNSSQTITAAAPLPASILSQ